MAEEDVEITIRLSELQQFIQQTKEAQTAVRQIGTGAEEGAQKAEVAVRKVPTVVDRIKQNATATVTAMHMLPSTMTAAGGGLDRLRSTANKPLVGGGMLGQLMAFAGGAISVQGIKDAVENTEQLALQAKVLHSVTGMSTKDAAANSAVVQAYGVSNRSYALALKTMATQTQNVTEGNKASTKIFGQLGIGMSTVGKYGGNLNSMLGIVVDHFNKLPAGTEKTAIATKLFGRSWQQLIPLFSSGSKGMADARQEAESMGITMGGNATKSAMKMHEAQIQLKLATMGLQMTFAEQLAPTLFKLLGIAIQLAGVVLHSMKPAFNILGNVVNVVTNFFEKHRTILKLVEIIMVALIAQFVYEKVAILAARGAIMLLNLAQNLGKVIMFAYRVAVLAVRAAMLIWQGTIWLVNAALDANPIAIVILAIIALIAVVVLVVTHFQQVKAVIIDAWNAIKTAFTVAINVIIGFVKAHWPLLLGIFTGPIGLIIALIYTFRHQIISAFQDVWDFVKTIPGKIAGAFVGLGAKIISPFKSAFDWIKNLHIHIKTTHIGPISVPSGISVTGMQFGGMVHGAGMALVGEAGPEILHLPRGAGVTPLNRTNNFTTIQRGDIGGIPPIEVSVQVDRREIARAVARANNDIRARR